MGSIISRFWITVRYNGAARWQPGGVFAIACALDMNFYPFDDQKCTMEIETWVYTSDKVNLTSSMNVVGIDTYIPHGEWSIIKTEVRGVNVIYSVLLRRIVSRSLLHHIHPTEAYILLHVHFAAMFNAVWGTADDFLATG